MRGKDIENLGREAADENIGWLLDQAKSYGADAFEEVFRDMSFSLSLESPENSVMRSLYSVILFRKKAD